MKVLCIRHGEACDSLSEKGKIQIKQAADILKKHNIANNAMVFTSPLKRAVESAKIITDNCGFKKAEVVQWLNFEESSPDYALNQIKNLMRIHEKKFSTMIVISHAPLLEGLIEIFGNRSRIGNGEIFEIDIKTRTCRRLV
ncbi:MAG: histidine phosphatase family protein [Candidatus Harrisonbacteria bacterium]|nr:histidine phosphatase family protein [Candidatus Harrisonbacteria bacterium]